jgi:hypothetical protein
MAEESSFFNDVNGDREYDMEAFATYFKQFLSSGLYHTDNVPALLVSKSTGLQTSMDTGSAYIEGFMYQNTEAITFLHEDADATNPRIDRIILRLDRNVNVRSINAMIKKGTATTNPQPPALTRNDVVYEISLAQVRINAGATEIASVKDERLDPSVAGLVSSLITVPTEQFINEWNLWMADMNQRKENYQQEWEDWFQGIQVQNPAMGGMLITVGSNAPTSPTLNDIWIDTNA